MPALEEVHGRTHNAEGARQAILDAAEALFAEHGFDGARINRIAAASSYNSSLLFHYFGDKLSLYAEVIKRADGEMTELQTHLLAPLLQDESIFSNAQAFKNLIAQTVAANFDYLFTHPRFTRILLWEQAEGWQTFAKIVARFDTAYSQQFEALFQKAHRAGLLRSDFPSLIQLGLILQICLSYLTYLPVYQLALSSSVELTSAPALANARQYLIDFVVHGMLAEMI
ncbi:MAG: TetR family transcriptional regulator [Anaerolineaceae bacterium]|nr:TetR family transcriptional regulator [Anaerolineaceae bacterium]